MVAVHGSPVEDYRRAPTGGLTTRYHGYTITDKSDEGQDASFRIEMGNPDWKEVRELLNETEESKRRWAISGLFIPAGLFIGMGIGWAIGYLVQGLFIGLGAGFLAMAIVRLKSGKW